VINEYPTEAELQNRITRHLKWRPLSCEVALIWHGYLAGLLEWGRIEIDVFSRLSALLPHIGNKEICELFADEPISPEQENEINEFIRRKTP
jgi:hypothetical protein